MTDNTEREAAGQAWVLAYAEQIGLYPSRDEISAFTDGWQARAALSAAPDAPTDEQIMLEARAYFDVTQEPDRKAMYSGPGEVVIAVVRAAMGYQGNAQREQDRLDAERYRFLRNRDNPLESQANAERLSAYHRVGEVRELKHGVGLDAAIDAAIAQAKEGKT